MSVRQSLRAKLAARRHGEICWSCSLKHSRYASRVRQSGLIELSCNRPDTNQVPAEASHEDTKAQENDILIRSVSTANAHSFQSPCSTKRIAPHSVVELKIRQSLPSQGEYAVDDLNQRSRVSLGGHNGQKGNIYAEKRCLQTSHDGKKLSSTPMIFSRHFHVANGKSSRLSGSGIFGEARSHSKKYNASRSCLTGGLLFVKNGQDGHGSRIYNRGHTTAAVSFMKSVLVMILTSSSAIILAVWYSYRHTGYGLRCKTQVSLGEWRYSRAP